MRNVPDGMCWILLVALLACDDGAGREPADGTLQWSVAAEPDILIGQQDGPSEYLFQKIAGVRLLPDGRVIVADRGFSTIRVFAADGTHLTVMGGAGEGPGEFGWMNHLSVVHPDTILIYDGDLYRITRFLPDGELVGTRPIRSEEGRPEVYVGTYSNGDAAIAWIAEAGRDPNVAIPDLMRIGRFGPDGSLTQLLGDTHGMRRMGPGPVPFSPYLHAFLVRDSVVHTDGRDASLFVLGDDGEVARELTISLPSVAVTQAWAALEEELTARERSAELDRIPEAARGEPIPRIAEVLVDSSNRFWIKRYEPRTDSHMLGGWAGARGGTWTIVGIQGRVVAQVTLPDDFILFDVAAEHLVGITRDELGVERVAVYGYGS